MVKGSKKLKNQKKKPNCIRKIVNSCRSMFIKRKEKDIRKILRKKISRSMSNVKIDKKKTLIDVNGLKTSFGESKYNSDDN